MTEKEKMEIYKRMSKKEKRMVYGVCNMIKNSYLFTEKRYWEAVLNAMFDDYSKKGKLKNDY